VIAPYASAPTAAPLRPESVRVVPSAVGLTAAIVSLLAFLAGWLGAGLVPAVIGLLGAAVSLSAAFASWRHASALRIAAPPAVTGFAGERLTIDVQVTNHALRARAFDTVFSFVTGDGSAPRPGALLTELAAGQSVRVEVVHPLMRRGLHSQGMLQIASSFPLGWWTCRLRFALPNEVLVLPRLGSLRRTRTRRALVRGDTGHGGAGRGDEQEIYGVRGWREGEGLRRVHWKLSARRGRLYVREFRSEPRPPVHVVLSLRVPDDGRNARNGFEQAVSLAATLVEDRIRAGHPVRLTLLGRATHTIQCRRGRGAIFPILRALAVAAAEPPSAEAGTRPRARRGEEVFLVRVGRRASVSAEGRTSVLDVTARGLAALFDPRRRPGSELLLGVRR
jgi:uncharacterized protein (DUF58 family)